MIYCESLTAMQLHECCVDLFSRDYEKTEYKAYLELKKNRLSATINYLAVPWHGAYESNNIEKIKKELQEVHLDGGFTVCYAFTENIKNPIIEIIKKTGINVIFTPRASTDCSSINGITIVSFPYGALFGVDPSPVKNILYSFIGLGSSHPIRKEIFKLIHHAQAVVKERTGWISSAGREEFKDVLARFQIFSLPKRFFS